jgi:cbb3-type cytochrome oxidase cytochrome c subunit
MSELLSKVAELLNAPESLVQRSAEARAEASGRTVDEVLQSWAGGESVASVEKPAEEAPPAEEPAAPVEDIADIEEPKEESAEIVKEENIEIKKESSLGFIAGVIGVVIFTYLFAFSIPKQQSEEVVLQSLNNSVRVSEEILEGAIVYNQLNCQSCHTQNVRILIPDSQNGKILKNRFANKNLIQNTGLLRLAPDLSTLGTREPTNDAEWLKEYLIDPSSVKEDIPHPSVNFLSNQDLDYLITYLLSLGESNE